MHCNLDNFNSAIRIYSLCSKVNFVINILLKTQKRFCYIIITSLTGLIFCFHDLGCHDININATGPVDIWHYELYESQWWHNSTNNSGLWPTTNMLYMDNHHQRKSEKFSDLTVWNMVHSLHKKFDVCCWPCFLQITHQKLGRVGTI